MVNEKSKISRKDYREYVRGGVAMRASIREHGGGRQVVDVVELSRAGLRVHSSAFIVAGRPIFVKLPGYNPLEARVIWSQGDIYGCEFTSRLHEAIFEDILKKYPKLRVLDE